MQPQDLVAYYWTGSIPQPRTVGDLSVFGARIVAPAGFYLGTVVELVLEDRTVAVVDEANRPHICVYGRVLRNVDDGFCVEFVFGDVTERRRFREFLDKLSRRTGDEPNAEKKPNARGAGSY